MCMALDIVHPARQSWAPWAKLAVPRVLHEALAAAV
jgi:hypothetical protein